MLPHTYTPQAASMVQCVAVFMNLFWHENILQVRQTMVKLLEEIRLDTSMEFERDMLMKSGLGKVVMFMYMNPDEAGEWPQLRSQLLYWLKGP